MPVSIINTRECMAILALDLLRSNRALSSEVVLIRAKHFPPNLKGSEYFAAELLFSSALRDWFEQKVPDYEDKESQTFLEIAITDIDWILVAQTLINSVRRHQPDPDVKWGDFTNALTFNVWHYLDCTEKNAGIIRRDAKQKVPASLDSKSRVIAINNFSMFLKAWYMNSVSSKLNSDRIFGPFFMEGINCVNWHEIAEAIVSSASN